MFLQKQPKGLPNGSYIFLVVDCDCQTVDYFLLAELFGGLFGDEVDSFEEEDEETIALELFLVSEHGEVFGCDEDGWEEEDEVAVAEAVVSFDLVEHVGE
jgi:hypothetical protein